MPDIMKEDSIKEDKVVNTNDEYELVVCGHRCPADLLHLFTPLEFEELVQKFIEYDVNKTNTIDVHEIRKLLHDLGKENTLEQAQTTLNAVDPDCEGELDFDHFCQFIIMIKQGDERLQMFHDLVEKLHSTPLGLIDAQAKMRNLKVKFILLEQREASSTNPAFFLFELQLSGIWHDLVKDVPQSHYELRRYQGVGQTSREAKYGAVTAALLSLEKQMPGIKYKVGVIPPEWVDWTDENLLRGVSPLQVATIFRLKGFHAHANPALMQRLCTWLALDDFLLEHPIRREHVVGVSMDAYLKRWIQEVVRWGMDGTVVMSVLEARKVNLSEHHPHFAQKLEHNELGVLLGADGAQSSLFDFWQSVSEGCLREAEIYLNSGQSPDEEQIGRHDNIARTPLVLAAIHHKVDMMKLLLKRGADISKLDRRGRTVLHIAADCGSLDACRLLLTVGGKIFDKDMQGNTPVHLACRGNYTETVALLMEQGQTYTRHMTADVVWPRRDLTFDQLVQRIFIEIPLDKLHKADTPRFEKQWLGEAADRFLDEMDQSKRYMLASPGPDIVEDILKRFDARPETGVYVISVVREEQSMVFIPTIETASDLSDLLRFLFRQASLDCTNGMKRTPLHVACDANNVNSHDKTISMLVDIYGCNVWMKDKNGKRPYDLLAQDKKLPTAPSATYLREEVMYERRQARLVTLSEEYAEGEGARRKARQDRILEHSTRIAEDLTTQLWHVTREASLLRKSFGPWDQYEDPDTLSYFFAKQPVDEIMGDVYTDYSWTVPPVAKAAMDRAWSWIFQKCDLSEYVRTVAGWEVYQCVRMGVEFFYHPNTDEYSLAAPHETTWAAIGPRNPVIRKIGFRDEWEEHEDHNGNHFYRRRHTNEYHWTKPRDAVAVTPSDLLCTVLSLGPRSRKQRYLTCEQCNKDLRDLQSKSEETVKSATNVRICEPCAARCHTNHRGVRSLGEGVILCSCKSLCAPVCACVARQPSTVQTIATRDAKHCTLEESRVRERNALSPFVFAMVPKVNRDGSPRREFGWKICRRAPPIDPFVSYRKAVEEQKVLQMQRQKAREERQAVMKAAKEAEALRNTPRRRPQSSSSSSESESDDIVSVMPVSVSASYTVGPDGLMITVGPESDDKGTGNQEEEEDEEESNAGNGFLGGDPLHTAVVAALEKEFPYERPPGLPEGWIEVLDPEEPEELDVGARILWWEKDTGLVPRRFYGQVLSRHRGQIYTIRPFCGTRRNDKDFNIPRDQIEALPAASFYCNLETGQSAWTVEDAVNRPMDSTSLGLSGGDWLKMHLCSQRRRLFQNWEELEDKVSGLIFYMDEELLNQEAAAVTIQIFWRQKRAYPRPKGWISNAFTFDLPLDALEEQRELAAWALIRRRSTLNKTVKDVDGIEWQELVDGDTAEHFYWFEEENVYQWEPPQIPSKDAEEFVAIDDLFEGDEVLFRFKGKKEPDPCVVTKIRIDDATHEKKYDIQHKFKKEIALKWVPRELIRRSAITVEQIKLQELEQMWRSQLRRTRDAQIRKSHAKREAKKELELARRFKRAARDAHKKYKESVKEQIAHARNRRIQEETRELEEAHEREVVRRHREELERRMREIQENNPSLSRSDVLQLRRAIDLQLDVQDRLDRRDALQSERLLRLKDVTERSEYVESTLSEMETGMTTPRSAKRRDVLRHVHIAMKRQGEGYMVCQWGCGEWLKVGREQLHHQKSLCVRRILPCALGCAVRMSEEEWLRPYEPPLLVDDENDSSTKNDEETDGEKEEMPELAFLALLPQDEGQETVQMHHERQQCVRRLVPCPRHCLEWAVFEELPKHMEEKCVKRPAEPLPCRLGCGSVFGGEQGALLLAEDERLLHEQEECEYRMVRCTWTFENGAKCTAQVCAKDRDTHRDLHLTELGVSTYLVAGTYLFKVPYNCSRLKIQMWGAGGGSGLFLDRKGGAGGGGAYVEALVYVNPHDVLEVVVGGGGSAGVLGQAMKPMIQEASTGEVKIVDAIHGLAPGGEPGGGLGYGGGHNWAAGGGGAYSMIARRTPSGNQALLVAAGGGGGSSSDGLPGSGMNGSLPGTRIDKRNGGTATATFGGDAGDSGNLYCSLWPAEDGAIWQGGKGCQYGAGGGGGYYGGGGGGTTPGVGGGGGGGASYIYTAIAKDYVIIEGNGRLPGGLTHDIPEAVGVGEWDTLGSFAGEGGIGDPNVTTAGNSGAVRMLKPGFY
eukprot:gene2379-4623_t